MENVLKTFYLIGMQGQNSLEAAEALEDNGKPLKISDESVY